MNCIQCGQELTVEARFCPECGAKVEAKVGAGGTAPVSRIDIGPLALGLPECKVEIAGVEAEGPDDSGDLRLTVKYTVTNDTDEDWEYLDTRTQILTAAGQIVDETHDTNEQTISAGESAELEAGFWIKAKALGANAEQAHVVSRLPSVSTAVTVAYSPLAMPSRW